MSVSHTPSGYHSVIPYLSVDNAAAALDFYKKAFDATEIMRMPMGDRIGHAEIKIGDAHVMLSDEFPEMDMVGPAKRGGTSVAIMIYVPDVDTIFARALKEGAREERAVQDQFYGDRSGTLVDPFGHRWMVATHIEDVSDEEIGRRLKAMTAEHA